MSNAQANTLVLKDEAGTYYLLSQETLEQGRVPAEHTAELERHMTATAQGGTGGADTEGYVAPVVAGVIVAGAVRLGFDIGYNLTTWYLNSQVEQVVPTIDLGSVGSREPLPGR